MHPPLALAEEIRVLNVTAELVESSVNNLLCSFHENDRSIVFEAKPKGLIEKRYFYILLLEMIEGVHAETVPSKNSRDNLLSLIGRIAKTPQLSNIPENVRRLADRSRQFSEWLAYEFSWDIYSANVDKEIRIQISRKDVLYLVGNRCKHSLARSNAITRKLVGIYRASGVSVSEHEETLLLQDIDAWFFDQFCSYHFTKICELCSNLHRAIIEYVRPEYMSRLRRAPDIVYYSYEVPAGLTRPDHVAEFYELLNRVPTQRMPMVQTATYLTSRY